MIAVDTNILVYAHRQDYEFHEAAQRALRSLATDDKPWGVVAHCLCEFYANVTSARIYKKPTSADHASLQLATLLDVPNLHVLGDTVETTQLWVEWMRTKRIAGPAVYDARIAAVCVLSGVSRLWTCDRDFSRYPEINVENPMV